MMSESEKKVVKNLAAHDFHDKVNRFWVKEEQIPTEIQAQQE